jgi:hypothetical protein
MVGVACAFKGNDRAVAIAQLAFAHRRGLVSSSFYGGGECGAPSLGEATPQRTFAR